MPGIPIDASSIFLELGAAVVGLAVLARVANRWGLVSVVVALAAVGMVLFVAVRFGSTISRVVSHESDEIILLLMCCSWRFWDLCWCGCCRIDKGRSQLHRGPMRTGFGFNRKRNWMPRSWSG
jgi:hypothetical protein